LRVLTSVLRPGVLSKFWMTGGVLFPSARTAVVGTCNHRESNFLAVPI
jgi:hypothetical protein